ncbi:unnamed protein product [Meloidogyne enterolobii]|uniref:Uncharacterized protein n=1 Tax=Meloidogyne enterolobii TaxID=390850 RepID=A0ACB0YZQ8_MELEN
MTGSSMGSPTGSSSNGEPLLQHSDSQNGRSEQGRRKIEEINDAFGIFKYYLSANKNFEIYKDIKNKNEKLPSKHKINYMPEWDQDKTSETIKGMITESKYGEVDEKTSLLIEYLNKMIATPQIMEASDIKTSIGVIEKNRDHMTHSIYDEAYIKSVLHDIQKKTNGPLGKIIEILKDYPPGYFNLSESFITTRNDITKLTSSLKERVEKIEKLFKNNLEGYIKNIVAEYFNFTQCGVEEVKRTILGNRVPECDGDNPKDWVLPTPDEWEVYCKKENCGTEILGEKELRTNLLNKLNGFKNVNFVEVIKEGKDEKWFINTFKYENEPLLKFLKFTKENLELKLEEERSIKGQGIIEGHKVESEIMEKIEGHKVASEKGKGIKDWLVEQIEEMLKTENWKDTVKKMLKRKKSLTRMLTFLEIYNEVEDKIEKKEELASENKAEIAERSKGNEEMEKKIDTQDKGRNHRKIRKERNKEEYGEEKKAEIGDQKKSDIGKEKKRDEQKVRDHRKIGEKGNKEEFGDEKKVEGTKEYIDDETLEKITKLLNKKVKKTYGEKLPMEDREILNDMLYICIIYRNERKDLRKYMKDIIDKKLLEVKKLLENPMKKNLETLLNFVKYYNKIVNEFAKFIETEVKVSSLIFNNTTFSMTSMACVLLSVTPVCKVNPKPNLQNPPFIVLNHTTLDSLGVNSNYIQFSVILSSVKCS